MSNIDSFRKLYLELETITLDKYYYYGESFYNVLNELKANRIYPYYSEYNFIDFCRKYRNSISHQELENKYLDFSDELINKLDRIIDIIKHPELAIDYASKNILSKKINDNVKEAMSIMKEKGYTYIPIYDHNKLIGVFSDRAIFNYLLSKNELIVNDNTTFKDIKEFININNIQERIGFVSTKTRFSDVIKLFTSDDNKKRLSCVFITDKGYNDEKVLGIISTYDIVSRLGKI